MPSTARTSSTSLPERIGAYLVEARLGAGGMAVVYRARHKDSGAVVALKTARSLRRSRLQSIRREVLALKRLDHPGVVQILDEGLSDPAPWYAMELIEGRSLRELFRDIWRDHLGPGDSRVPDSSLSATQQAIPSPSQRSPHRVPLSVTTPPEERPLGGGQLETILNVFVRLCDTLAFVHGEGIIHRDLSPRNVICREDGWPVLVDFGLFGRFGGARGREVIDQRDRVMGTPRYMAPEQIQNRPLDARADLYALGCMLYEFLTGRAPHLGDRPKALFESHLQTPPTPIDALVSDPVPEPLASLVEGLLAKDPSTRLGFATQVAEVLEALGAERQASVAPQAYLYRPAFHGRASALEALDRQLEEVVDSQASTRVVLLEGESGVGKTRTVSEWLDHTQRKQAELMLYTGECSPSASQPFHPFRGLLQILADRCSTGGRRETERLLGYRRHLLAEIEPSLRNLPDVGVVRLPELRDREAARRRLFSHLAETLQALGEEHTLLLVIDDVQWADALTLGFLEALAREELTCGKCLVVATCRLESAKPITTLAEAAASTLHLERLDPETMGSISHSMLGDGASLSQGVVDFLTEHAGGNPFFASEYLRAALEEGWITRGERGYVLTDEAAVRLPDSLQALIDLRLRHVSPTARTLLDAAAVMGGQAIPLSTWVHVSELEEHQALAGVAELLRRQIVEESDVESGLRFTHAKLCEVVYQRLDGDRRQAWHHRVARVLEAAQGPARALAHHWEEASEPGRARAHVLQAALAARDMSAYEEARRLFERARELTETHGLGTGTLPDTPDALDLAYAEVLVFVGDTSRASEQLEALLARLGAPVPHSRLEATRSITRAVLGRLAAHLTPRPLHTARSEAERRRCDLLALAADRYSNVSASHNKLLETILYAIVSVNAADRTGGEAAVAASYALMGSTLAQMGMKPLARSYFAHAERLVESTGRGQIAVLFYACYAATVQVQWERLEALSKQGLALAAEAGNAYFHELFAVMRAGNIKRLGDFAAASRAYEEVWRSARESKHTLTEQAAIIEHIRTLQESGRLLEAEPLLPRFEALIEARPNALMRANLTSILAVMDLHRGNTSSARVRSETTLNLLGRAAPSNGLVLYTLSNVLDVLLYAWRRGRSERGLEKRAAQAMRSFRVGIIMSKQYRAQCYRYRGLVAELKGRSGDAQTWLERSAACARELGYPIEEAKALLHLGRLSDPSSGERGRAILRELDLDLYLDHIPKVLDGLYG